MLDVMASSRASPLPQLIVFIWKDSVPCGSGLAPGGVPTKASDQSPISSRQKKTPDPPEADRGFRV